MKLEQAERSGRILPTNAVERPLYLCTLLIVYILSEAY
jgi:hypothetical protein